MRCLNCSTVCHESETRCVACGYEIAEPEARFVPKSKAQKCLFGIPLLLLSVFLLLAGAAFAAGAYTRESQGARVYATEEMIALQPENMEDSWVSYSFRNSIPTGVQRVTYRKGVRRVVGYFLLVQVGDRWVLACAERRFEGSRLVGQVQPWNAEFSEAMTKVAKAYPAQSKRLLPYVIDAEYGFGSSSRWMYIPAGILAILGFTAGRGGFRCLRAEVPSEQAGSPAGQQLSAAFRPR